MSYRVLTAEIAHETNTFSKVPTGLEAFRRRVFLTANEIPGARRGTRSDLGATFEAAEKFGWTLSYPVAASANPSGRVTDEAFETLADMLLSGADGGIDGALLHLHGAMVTDSHEDGEGELLRRLRAKVGPDVPVVVTLDLHGNITELMATCANALIAVRTYPHVDYYERAWQGAELLQRAMKGEIRPRTVIARRPMLRGLDGGRTQTGPMRELIDRGEQLERDGRALVVSICSGFTAADIHDIGPSVTVTTDGDDAAGRAIAEEFMDYAWKTRDFASVTHWSIDDAVRHAKEGEGKHDRPLIMADVTDNPGSGHYGDATNLLRAMIAADLQNTAFYAIYDPQAAREGARIGVGNSGAITLGGKHDPQAGGEPLTLTGHVVALTDGHFQTFGPMGGGVWRDYGLSMLLRVGGIDIVVISNNGQAVDTAQLTSLGVDPTRKNTVAVKSNHHFRAAFQPIGREVITVDGGGLGSVIWRKAGFTKVRRPIWPLDPLD
ncbi:M81 family metallopeptidase [Limobrevibacterium gyesilva]|uniref:Microcystinase C n=1 Tax=Limobrevibacterium gyesilva TaxID=2991712 RepID=A0AA41YLD1_9PROT|nr:M81 family metallopeptidase [Limobrevibacterium gyesilva]MCW3474058.1 M81 family metallopeptidase [Limobrevibacterium gyesilva]